MSEFYFAVDTNANRLARTWNPGVLWFTSDQQRLFQGDGITLGGSFIGPAIDHGSVANQAAMLALNSGSRGCFPGDTCHRTDQGRTYLCRLGNGTNATDWVPILAAVSIDDVDDSTLPTNGAIAALTFSATPTQAECEALRNECEALRDTLAAAITTIRDLRTALA